MAQVTFLNPDAIQDGAIITDKIADNAITSDKIAAGAKNPLVVAYSSSVVTMDADTYNKIKDAGTVLPDVVITYNTNHQLYRVTKYPSGNLQYLDFGGSTDSYARVAFTGDGELTYKCSVIVSNGNFLKRIGGSMTGALTVLEPTENSNPATKKYVDENYLPITGGHVKGRLRLWGDLYLDNGTNNVVVSDGTNDIEISYETITFMAMGGEQRAEIGIEVREEYDPVVDNTNFTPTISVHNAIISNVGTPEENNDAATKKYVDELLEDYATLTDLKSYGNPITVVYPASPSSLDMSRVYETLHSAPNINGSLSIKAIVAGLEYVGVIRLLEGSGDISDVSGVVFRADNVPFIIHFHTTTSGYGGSYGYVVTVKQLLLSESLEVASNTEINNLFA